MPPYFQRGNGHSSSLPLDEFEQSPFLNQMEEMDFDVRLFKLITWNVGGYNRNLSPEFSRQIFAIAKEIFEKAPDVVFLQELSDQCLPEIVYYLSPYYSILDPEGRSGSGMYCGILLSPRMKFLSFDLKSISCGGTDRHMIKVRAEFRSHPCVHPDDVIDFVLMTAHFKSGYSPAESRLRQEQLVYAFKQMQKHFVRRNSRRRTHVICGGDFNLRDVEVDEVGGLPEHIQDLWEVDGYRRESCYTWDTCVNHNRRMRFERRYRFDRIYWYAPPAIPSIHAAFTSSGMRTRTVTLQSFKLTGKERLPNSDNIVIYYIPIRSLGNTLSVRSVAREC